METDIPEHPLEKNNIVLDPLPYVDEYTSEMQEEVQALLKQEMKYYTYEESGNIYTPTPLELNSASKMVNEEFQRMVSTSTFKVEGLEFKRYQLIPPETEEVADWEEAIVNAKAQLEHMRNRTENMEIQTTYGTSQWTLYNTAMEKQVADLNTKLTAATKANNALNIKRKQEQIQAGFKLKQLEKQSFDLYRKNAEIEAACLALEAEIAQLEPPTALSAQ